MLAWSPGTLADCRKPRQSSTLPKSTLTFVTFPMSVNKRFGKGESTDTNMHSSRRLCCRYGLVEERDRTCGE